MGPHNIILLVIVLVEVTTVLPAVTLEISKTQNSKSECVVVTSRRESRYVPYQQSYRVWGYYRTRWNYKIEYSIVWTPKMQCCEGYVVTPDDPACIPYCRQNCEEQNARCTFPDTCTCLPNYEMPANSTRCEPVCEPPCTNGECVSPNVCSCHPGYVRNPETGSPCEPVCTNGCIYGSCTGPESCTCKTGYAISAHNESLCEPVCSEPCVMGSCVGPESCECFEGYSLTGESMYVCTPVCEDCVHGVCTEPGVCSCNKGYWRGTGDDQRVCKPFCEVPCEPYGNCTAPGTCTCFEGYRLIDASRLGSDISNNVTDAPSTACEPVCNVSCTNGKCIAPGMCSCNDGYAKDAYGLCAPLCHASCLNGTCVAPSRCSCYDGYVPFNGSACVPFCEKGCENGMCAAPNECRCQDGYEISENDTGLRCVNACPRNCSGHGLCIGHQNCECNFGWSGRNCEEATVCVLTMSLGDKGVDRLTVRNDTNDMLVEARDSLPYCYQCNHSLNNKTLCYIMQSNDETPVISCFVDTVLPCNVVYQFNGAADASKVAGSLAAVTILLIAGATTILYYLFRRHQRQKVQPATLAQTTVLQGSIGTESLLSDEEVCLQ